MVMDWVSDGHRGTSPRQHAKACQGAPPPSCPSLANAGGEDGLGRNNRDRGTRKGCEQNKSLALQWHLPTSESQIWRKISDQASLFVSSLWPSLLLSQMMANCTIWSTSPGRTALPLTTSHTSAFNQIPPNPPNTYPATSFQCPSPPAAHGLGLSTFASAMLRAIPVHNGRLFPSCTHMSDPDKIQQGRGSWEYKGSPFLPTLPW